MRNIILALVFAVLLGLTGCASVGSYAQTQQQTSTEQNQEIDYKNMNLLKSDRTAKIPDFYGDKVFFAANIGAKGNLNYEIFTCDSEGNGQKRITFTQNVSEFNPFYTTNKKIAFFSTTDGFDRSYFIMDEDGNNKREISKDRFRALAEDRIKQDNNQ